MSRERILRIALNSIPYLHPLIHHRLIAAMGSAEEVFNSPKARLAEVEGVPASLAERILETDPDETGERELALASEVDASITLLGEDGYPGPLANVHSPPPVLSIRGEWRKEDELSIAVVGTRGVTAYGKVMAARIAKELAESGFTLVSGLARGVDGVAHRASLDAGGRTVAVLGNGLNVYYPPEHRKLQNRIPECGAVISQFPFIAGPHKTRFPIRNRVISGLSLGTLVVEAPVKSGALITAYSALDQNRDAFAFPGPVNSPKSEGTNRLIKKGHAKLVQNIDDIIDELPDYIRDSVRSRQTSLDLKEDAELSGEEVCVVEVLDASEKHIDIIAQDAGLPLGKVSAILLSLELKGLAKQMAGKMFIRN